ncbi:uncharacterized protein LOC111622393 [Centruroides sculpturatus]|uniref:uncharacterized protein LOC111622393 n=1 Tax=Centruroides sculpturatus TaxID=218467 RepID=UPI000C6D930D|nr:uncharacterized protein LOC111622393 [Centruroides sculpturatus]
MNNVLRTRGRSNFHPTAGCFLMGAFAVCCLVFGVIMAFAGSIVMGIAYGKVNSLYPTSGSLQIIGPILTTVGILSLLTSVLLLCIGSRLAKIPQHLRTEEETTLTAPSRLPSISHTQVPASPNAYFSPTEFSNPQYFEPNNCTIQQYPDLPPPYSETDPTT